MTAATMFEAEPVDAEPEVANALAIVPTENPMVLLSILTQRGASVESIERVSALVERWQDRQAETTYADAIAGFQSECPAIFKGRQADRYSFANYDDVMFVIHPLLTKYKISVSATVANTGNILNITIRLRVGSHFEDKEFPSPIATGISLSAPQLYGQTLKYLQRYALCAALNIRTTDIKDNDGAGAFIDGEQVRQINDLLIDTKTDLKKFLAWAKIEALDAMPATFFDEAIRMLKKKVSK
jgi:hypothetical protein